MRFPVLLALLAFAACDRGGGTVVALLDYRAVVPAGFEARPATSSMRLAEYTVPEVDGATAEVIVFYFGPGQGGSAEANIARWSAQFRGADGGPVAPRVTTLEGASFPTTLAEYEGSYARGVGMGPGRSAAEPGQALSAAVVETALGNLFLQLVGDQAAVAAAREDFLAMVASIS
ncbi:MAG TPA: hypothetical protein VLA09_11495 [Longimicrobiales bacterium]|nr:hypothetical protein [Longimicrobiales bacterium]